MTPRKPRRIVLADLKTIKTAATWLQNRWDVSSKVYDTMGGRPREPHEYPENRPEDWATLQEVTGNLIAVLQDLHDYAADQRTNTSN